MSTTRTRWLLNAPRARVYRALTTAADLQRWRVPPGMSCEIHAYDPREGGTFRISLSYVDLAGTGKTTARTDTFHGRFVKLVPDQEVVEALEFETTDPSMMGEMRITYTLRDADGGTELVAVHEGVPPGVSPDDNALGWRQSLGQLAALVGGSGVSDHQM